ncbi:hypothetical protein HK102_003569, partial [Quaeritorhiza haematococci]
MEILPPHKRRRIDDSRAPSSHPTHNPHKPTHPSPSPSPALTNTLLVDYADDDDDDEDVHTNNEEVTTTHPRHVAPLPTQSGSCGIDFSRLFSDEIALTIFGYLSHRDLTLSSVVSRRWRSLAADQH